MIYEKGRGFFDSLYGRGAPRNREFVPERDGRESRNGKGQQWQVLKPELTPTALQRC